jgi:hypothetical protein
LNEQSSLPLLVLGILAQHPHHTLATNHFAFVTDLLDRCSNLHGCSCL